MSFDMIEAMTVIAREKNIEFDTVLETLKAGLMAAAKKKYTFTDNITFRFDRKANELEMIATKRVVDPVTDANVEISLKEAKDIVEQFIESSPEVKRRMAAANAESAKGALRWILMLVAAGLATYYLLFGKH